MEESLPTTSRTATSSKTSQATVRPNHPGSISKSTASKTDKINNSSKSQKHAVRYIIVGASLTIFNYLLYALLANVLIRNNDLLWLSSLIATAITTIAAYISHSKITWKDRHVTRAAIYKFFIWNIILTVAVSPAFTQIFSLLTPLYEVVFNISNAIHLPFSYEFILTTGAFVLTSAVIMILNFLLYDRFVFGEKKDKANKETSHHDR